MIKHRAGKGVGVMTILTDITALDMIRRFTYRNTAIMAGTTTAVDLGMINPGFRRPAV